jgi:hypothetical protein
VTLVGIKRGLVRSVIVCQDLEFKRKSVAFLNNSAISGEKFHVESIPEAIEMMAKDSMIRNLIVDGRIFTNLEIEAVAGQLQQLTQTGSIRVLCYLSDDQPNLEEQLDEGANHIYFSYSPMSQAVFNRAFTMRGERETQKEGRQAIQAKEKPALSLLEASKHVKETVSLLNQFIQDRTDISPLLKVGQRFNGLAASLLFLKEKPGYLALSQMAGIIDEVCRHYEREGGEVLNHHITLVQKSAKCSYLLLKELRSNEPSQVNLQKLMQGAEALNQEFISLSDLKRREQLDQDLIDSLLEKEQLKAK